MMRRFYAMLPQLDPYSLMNISIGIEHQLISQNRSEFGILPRDKQVQIVVNSRSFQDI
jgi:hypothetical protein